MSKRPIWQPLPAFSGFVNRMGAMRRFSQEYRPRSALRNYVGLPSPREAHGFDVPDIKRINRKEFDVIAVKNGVIFNLQCKNNWIDLGRLEADRESFVKLNRRLV
jgi:hypothetical protein